MNKQKNDTKRRSIPKEQKLERLHYGMIIGLMISFVLHYMLFDGETIGQDKRYDRYIFWMPILTGILVLGIYRKDFLMRQYWSVEKVYEKICILGWYLIQGIVISYLSFGQVSHIVWNYLNKKEAERNPTEMLTGTITGFGRGKRTTVDFKCNNQYESLKVSRETIGEYDDEKPEDYVLIMQARKGIWNYYVIESWSIEKRKQIMRH